MIGKAGSHAYKSYRVHIDVDGRIKARKGDWLSKYSAAIYNGDVTRVYEYGRMVGGKLVPVENVDEIKAAETLYHIPTHEAYEYWRRPQPGGPNAVCPIPKVPESDDPKLPEGSFAFEWQIPLKGCIKTPHLHYKFAVAGKVALKSPSHHYKPAAVGIKRNRSKAAIEGKLKRELTNSLEAQGAVSLDSSKLKRILKSFSGGKKEIAQAILNCVTIKLGEKYKITDSTTIKPTVGATLDLDLCFFVFEIPIKTEWKQTIMGLPLTPSAEFKLGLKCGPSPALWQKLIRTVIRSGNRAAAQAMIQYAAEAVGVPGAAAAGAGVSAFLAVTGPLATFLTFAGMSALGLYAVFGRNEDDELVEAWVDAFVDALWSVAPADVLKPRGGSSDQRFVDIRQDALKRATEIIAETERRIAAAELDPGGRYRIRAEFAVRDYFVHLLELQDEYVVDDPDTRQSQNFKRVFRDRLLEEVKMQVL